MGGFDLLLSDLLRKEIESSLGKKIVNKLEKRLFEKYGMTMSETMNNFEKFDDVLKEIFGSGSKGIIRSVLNNLCNLKKNNRKKDNIVTLYDPRLTETILEVLGDKDYRKILDMLIDKSMTPYEIQSRLDIPQASAYRKIESLVNTGLLVENEKIQGRSGRPAVKLSALYQGLDMCIIKNRVTVQVKISRDTLQKSSIFCTLYGI